MMKLKVWLAGVVAVVCLGSLAFAEIDVQGYFNANGSLKSDKVRQDIKNGTVDPVELVKALVTKAPGQAAAIVAAAVTAAPDRMAEIVAAAKAAAPDQAAAIDEAARDASKHKGKYTLTLEGAMGDRTDPTTFKELSPSQ